MGGPQVSVSVPANKDPLAKLTKLGKLSEQGGTHAAGWEVRPFPQPAPPWILWPGRGRAGRVCKHEGSTSTQKLKLKKSWQAGTSGLLYKSSMGFHSGKINEVNRDLSSGHLKAQGVWGGSQITFPTGDQESSPLPKGTLLETLSRQEPTPSQQYQESGRHKDRI